VFEKVNLLKSTGKEFETSTLPTALHLEVHQILGVKGTIRASKSNEVLQAGSAHFILLLHFMISAQMSF